MLELNSDVVMTNWPELVLWSRKCNPYICLEVDTLIPFYRGKNINNYHC